MCFVWFVLVISSSTLIQLFLLISLSEGNATKACDRMSLLPTWFKGVTPDLIKKAELELNETPSVKAEALAELRKLINEQQNLYSRLDDGFLLKFLRTKKFNVSKAFKVLRNYYNFQHRNEGVFTRRKPSELRKVIDMNNLFYPPYRLPDGSHIAIIRFGSYDPHIATGEEFMSAIFVCSELILECEATQITGGNLIVDLSDATLHQYKMFMTFSFIKFLVNALEECWPERLRSIHILNEPYALHAIFHIAKHLAKKKLIERIHFHGNDMTRFHELIPKEFLPEELGGTLGPLNNKELVSYFFSQEGFLEKANKYGYLDKMK